jgi:4-hydroxy-tetrahydrodipicolinate reductase
MRTDQQPVRIALFAPDGRMGKAVSLAIAEDRASNWTMTMARSWSISPHRMRRLKPGPRDLGWRAVVGQDNGLIDEHEALIAEAAKSIPVLHFHRRLGGLLADHAEAPRYARTGRLGRRDHRSHHNKRRTLHPVQHCNWCRCRPRSWRQFLQERGREGTGLKRRTGAIGYAAIRGGTVAGDHDVMFLGPEERLILSHRAESRAIFARGALAAAKFLKGKPAGLYSMRDVIDAA